MASKSHWDCAKERQFTSFPNEVTKLCAEIPEISLCLDEICNYIFASNYSCF